MGDFELSKLNDDIINLRVKSKRDDLKNVLKSNLFGGFNKNDVIEYISKIEKKEKDIQTEAEQKIEEFSNIINNLMLERDDFTEKLSESNRELGQNLELVSSLEINNANLMEVLNSLKTELESLKNQPKIHIEQVVEYHSDTRNHQENEHNTGVDKGKDIPPDTTKSSNNDTDEPKLVVTSADEKSNIKTENGKKPYNFSDNYPEKEYKVTPEYAKITENMKSKNETSKKPNELKETVVDEISSEKIADENNKKDFSDTNSDKEFKGTKEDAQAIENLKTKSKTPEKPDELEETVDDEINNGKITDEKNQYNFSDSYSEKEYKATKDYAKQIEYLKFKNETLKKSNEMLMNYYTSFKGISPTQKCIFINQTRVIEEASQKIFKVANSYAQQIERLELEFKELSRIQHELEKQIISFKKQINK